MSTCVSQSFHSTSTLKNIVEDSPKLMKQGIVSILGSDSQTPKKAASLRKTLSADMSSKKWLAQNGFHPMKKIASFKELPGVVSDQGEEGKGQDEIWASIQSKKHEEKNGLGLLSDDALAWGSILTEKKENSSSNLPPPYVHPLVKRTTSSLTEKSLEVCTESLGSETGSDHVFTSDPTSENGDQEEDKVDGQKVNPRPQQEKNSFDEVQVVKYNFSCGKKLPTKSFPPPLPSLAGQDGGSLQVHSHRENGRLVLEAVSIPTQNNFHAERHDGRLVLSLVDDSESHDETFGEAEDEIQEFVRVFDDIDEVERDEEVELDDEDEEGFEEEDKFEEEESEGFMIEQSTKLPSGVISVHKAAFMMNKYMGFNNKNLTWSPKLINKSHVKLVEVDDNEMVVENELTSLPQSLPPPPRVARLISSAAPPAATSFNAYEYFWREKQSLGSIVKSVPQDSSPTHIKSNQNKVIFTSNLKGYEQQNLVLMRGDKADYLVPLVGRCNEPRRSLLFWEPQCIATS